MKVFVYPGSFDPVTNGHMDIIERAIGICDKLIVGILINNKKESTFSVKEREDMLKSALNGRANIEVTSFSGLLVDFMKQNNVTTVIRGLRAVSDFENEFQLALLNKNQYPDMETLFMMTSSNYLYLSSSMVKELAIYKGNIDSYVPACVKEALIKKFTNI
ncbi:MAG TPA: pantetheine-phosphate adenylyltransferase [Clostridia bacterium]|nr:pantetheine-phosphate adenylyltransferase [Clostridia bacterium]